MKIDKNFFCKAIAVVFYLLCSQYSYATTTQILVRVPCSKDFLSAVDGPWVVYPGIPGVQYALNCP